MPANGAHFSGQGHLIEAVVSGDPNNTVVPVVCDSQGRLIIDLSSSTITIGTVDIQDSAGNPLTSVAGSLNTNVTNFPAKQAVDNLTQLVPFEFDYVAMSPTGTNPTTIVYKTGGAGGTTVATLTLTYDANLNVQTVART